MTPHLDSDPPAPTWGPIAAAVETVTGILRRPPHNLPSSRARRIARDAVKQTMISVGANIDGPRPSDATADVGGDLVDIGDGPFSLGSVVLDLNRAVLLDALQIARVDVAHPEGAGADWITALVMHGRVNGSPDRANVLFLIDTDGAASLVTEILSLAARSGPDAVRALRADIATRLDGMLAAHPDHPDPLAAMPTTIRPEEPPR